MGRGGQFYKIWKLRSMVPDADQKLESHLADDPAARAEWDETQKLKNDPRITAFGRFLRRSSLDELPQLWNVLRGDMSLVGPRPMMPSQVTLYPGQGLLRPAPGHHRQLADLGPQRRPSFADRCAFRFLLQQQPVAEGGLPHPRRHGAGRPARHRPLNGGP